MRLGTCIALELAVAAGAVGGVWFGMGATADLANHYLVTHEASAATSASITSPPARLPEAKLSVAAPAPRPTVFGATDGDLLAPLAGTVTAAKINGAGTSLSMRLDFASGARAAFKPQQTHPQSDPRKEIAAYRIDRLLGIGHVPPAKSVALPVDEILAAVDPALRTYTAARMAGEAIVHDGIVRGELSWWIPEIRNARFGAVSLDDKEGMALWQAFLQPGVKLPAELRDYLAQIATCVVFDVLIDNADRWTGSNTKVSADRSVLYFMDNTLSFSPFTLGHQTNLEPLVRISVFPKQLLERVRALTYDSIAAALATGDDGGLAPLLTAIEIRAILARRDHILQHVDRQIAEFGEAAVLALP